MVTLTFALTVLIAGLVYCLVSVAADLYSRRTTDRAIARALRFQAMDERRMLALVRQTSARYAPLATVPTFRVSRPTAF